MKNQFRFNNKRIKIKIHKFQIFCNNKKLNKYRMNRKLLKKNKNI